MLLSVLALLIICVPLDNPRVTRFNIDWDRPNPETSFMMSTPGGEGCTMMIAQPSEPIWTHGNTTLDGLSDFNMRMIEERARCHQLETNENMAQGVSSSRYPNAIGLDRRLGDDDCGTPLHNYIDCSVYSSMGNTPSCPVQQQQENGHHQYVLNGLDTTYFETKNHSSLNCSNSSSCSTTHGRDTEMMSH